MPTTSLIPLSEVPADHQYWPRPAPPVAVRIPSRLLTWVVSAMDTVGMPDGFEIADWNWREYAASIGVKGDIPTCAESAKIAAATTG